MGRLGEENDDGEELLGNISLMFDLKIGFFFYPKFDFKFSFHCFIF